MTGVVVMQEKTSTGIKIHEDTGTAPAVSPDSTFTITFSTGMSEKPNRDERDEAEEAERKRIKKMREGWKDIRRRHEYKR